MTSSAVTGARRALRRVLDGAGLVVEVAGEPGIGRSHLLDVLAREAATAGAAVLRDIAVLPDSAGGSGGLLVDVLGGEIDMDVAGIGELLAVRAAAGPLVLLLDDLHRADAATHVQLADLVAAARTPGVLVVLSRCATSHPPWAGRADMCLELVPLSRDDAEPLLAGLSPAAADAVFERSGGNPFLLLHLARAGGDGVPGVVVEVIGSEVEALPVQVRRLVRGAAVLGATVDPGLAGVAAGILEPVDADLLLVGGLLVRDGAAVRFRRPLVGEAVYAGTGPAWRLAAHERLGAALAARGAPVAQRARHLERCARPGDADAVAVLAAAAAAEPVVATAARWYAAATRLLPADAPERTRLAAAHAVTLGSAGRLDEARSMLRALVDRGTPLSGVAARMLADADRLLGGDDPQPPVPAGTPPTDAAHLHLAHADRLAELGEHDAALRHAVEAVVAASRAGAQRLAAEALLAAAAGEFAAGRVEAARRCAARARPVVDVDGDAGLLAGLSAVELACEQLRDAEAHARRGLDAVARTGRRLPEVQLLAALAMAQLGQGHIADAADSAQQAQAAADPCVARDVIAALAARLRVAVAAGDRAGVIDRAAEIVSGGRIPPDAAVHLAAAALDSGDPRGCLDGLPAAAGGPGLDALPRPDRPQAYELLVRAALAVNDPAGAAGWAQRAELACLDLPGRLAQARRAAAEVHLAHGRTAEAVADARAAVDAAAGLPLDAGRSGVLLGRALATAGEHAGATAALRAAHDLLTRCAALRAADEAAQLLRRLGEREPRRRAAGSASDQLSRREREVADLVAAQMTNREIAAALFLSEKTVESHLAAVFRKLGVRSRTAVAAQRRARAADAGSAGQRLDEAGA